MRSGPRLRDYSLRLMPFGENQGLGPRRNDVAEISVTS